MKKKLIVAVALLSLALLVLGVLVFQHFTGEMLTHARQRARVEAEALMSRDQQRLQLRFATSQQKLLMFAGSLNQLEQLSTPELCRRIDDVVGYAGFQKLLVARPDGLGTDSAGRTYDVHENHAFRRARGGTCAYALHSGVVDPQALVLAAPIIEGAHLRGVVLGEFNMEFLSETLSGDQQHRSVFSLVRYDGEVILKPTGMQDVLPVEQNIFEVLANANYDEGSAAILRKHLSFGESTRASYQLGSEKRMVYFMPLGLNNWYLMRDVPENYIESMITPVSDMVLSLLLRMLLLAVALAALFVFIFHRVRSMEARREDLEARVQFDQMTGLYNRAYAISRAKQCLTDSKALLTALIICDMNEFKHVNDTYGHQMGDEVLIAVARVLRMSFRAGECPGRIGGDEFMICATGIRDQESFVQRLNFIREDVAKLRFSNPDVHVSISVGGVLFTGRDESDYEALFQQADKNMYQSKESDEVVVELL